MKILKASAPILLAAFLMASCNSGEKKSNNDKSESTDISEILDAANAISPDINSVDDVIKTLEVSSAKYFPMLCNDPYNATNYLNDKSVAAANLGVYVTDIIYHTYGDGTDDMYLAFSASQELARYIGLESEFAATLLTELEGGNISRDSLILVFNGLMRDSESYNSEKEMLYVHSAFLGGIYVEKLYLLSSLIEQGHKKTDPGVEDVDNYKKLVAVYKNQLVTIDDLTESLKSNAKDLNIVLNMKEVDQLKGATESFLSVSEEILNAEAISSPEAVANLHKIILDIRSRIVTAG